jgi:hypothetical protein
MQVKSRLTHLEQVGCSFGHLTFDRKQLSHESRNFRRSGAEELEQEDALGCSEASTSEFWWSGSIEGQVTKIA